ncbi:MAG: hypothetical protein ACLGGX_10525 [Bdellovibrionia bacterium]
MKKRSFLFPIFLLIIFAFGTRLTGEKLEFDQTKFMKTPPMPMVERFVFGFHETVADLFWIQAIQGFDYCENEIAKNTCQPRSWLYQMLDAITNLSPHFRMPQATGPLALTVIISDYEGASLIFDKAVRNFPKDWPILYRASYHALYEEKDKTKAAGLMVQAAQNGAPAWLYSLASRLYSEEGQREVAWRLYEDLKNSGLSAEILERVRQKLLEKQAN